MDKTLEALCEKILRDLEENPQNRKFLNSDNFKEGLKSLCAFVNAPQDSFEKFLLRLGVKVSGYTFLNLSSEEDSSIYDIVFTYELQRRLKKNNWNWEQVEKDLTEEFLNPNQMGGEIPEITFKFLLKAFEEVKTLLKDKGPLSKIEPNMFVRKESELICLL